MLCRGRDQRYGQNGAVPATGQGSDTLDIDCDDEGESVLEIRTYSSYSCRMLPAVQVEGRALLRLQDRRFAYFVLFWLGLLLHLLSGIQEFLLLPVLNGRRGAK